MEPIIKKVLKVYDKDGLYKSMAVESRTPAGEVCEKLGKKYFMKEGDMEQFGLFFFEGGVKQSLKMTDFPFDYIIKNEKKDYKFYFLNSKGEFMSFQDKMASQLTSAATGGRAGTGAPAREPPQPGKQSTSAPVREPPQPNINTIKPTKGMSGFLLRKKANKFDKVWAISKDKYISFYHNEQEDTPIIELSLENAVIELKVSQLGSFIVVTTSNSERHTLAAEKEGDLQAWATELQATTAYTAVQTTRTATPAMAFVPTSRDLNARKLNAKLECSETQSAAYVAWTDYLVSGRGLSSNGGDILSVYSDGLVLINLIEELFGRTLKYRKGKSVYEMQYNIDAVLEALQQVGADFGKLLSQDIVECKVAKIIHRVIWSIFIAFISNGEKEYVVKDKLIGWCNARVGEVSKALVVDGPSGLSNPLDGDKAAIYRGCVSAKQPIQPENMMSARDKQLKAMREKDEEDKLKREQIEEEARKKRELVEKTRRDDEERKKREEADRVRVMRDAEARKADDDKKRADAERERQNRVAQVQKDKTKAEEDQRERLRKQREQKDQEERDKREKIEREKKEQEERQELERLEQEERLRELREREQREQQDDDVQWELDEMRRAQAEQDEWEEEDDRRRLLEEEEEELEQLRQEEEQERQRRDARSLGSNNNKLINERASIMNIFDKLDEELSNPMSSLSFKPNENQNQKDKSDESDENESSDESEKKQQELEYVDDEKYEQQDDEMDGANISRENEKETKSSTKSTSNLKELSELMPSPPGSPRSQNNNNNNNNNNLQQSQQQSEQTPQPEENRGKVVVRICLEGFGDVLFCSFAIGYDTLCGKVRQMVVKKMKVTGEEEAEYSLHIVRDGLERVLDDDEILLEAEDKIDRFVFKKNDLFDRRSMISSHRG
ncbi:pleckstrin domain-containing protein [Cavenderia fasciculata]|uniref:Pleckstrin domain-containing protein n=1 Tax=Cavenderia fasciculata TaxID=261658 RepID=F4PHL0_CACFS|nr:pleckstrin domain-containing protein [Cavenderia fasciculata]EGG25194.1 pleckstrin domain-containing protein [Cavenderia fasciculata]|eukprot:XP_004363045.1 pleckstrin domain-containing protein [Cavenderia fasciculata]